MKVPKKFKWKAPPTTSAEFEEFMRAVDTELFQRAVPVIWRPEELTKILKEAFRWKCPMWSAVELTDTPQWQKDQASLLHRMEGWYSDVYQVSPGQDLSKTFALKLGNDIWEVDLPVDVLGLNYVYDRTFKTFSYSDLDAVTLTGKRHSVNVLSLVSGLTPEVTQRVSNVELDKFVWSLAEDSCALMFLDELCNNTDSQWFCVARADRNVATQALNAGFYAQAAWSTQQATEKLLKGVMALSNIEPPQKGYEAHDILKLGKLLANVVELDTRLMDATNWSTHVRYGKEVCGLHSAYESYRAFHYLLNELNASRLLYYATEGLFKTVKRPGSASVIIEYEDGSSDYIVAIGLRDPAKS